MKIVRILKSKKGEGIGTQISFLMFLFMMVIVATGLALGASAVYYRGYDFRHVDSNLLAYEVKECMSNNIADVSSGDFFKNLYVKCGISEKVVENNYGLKICLGGDFDSCRRGQDNILFRGGKQDFVACALNNAENGGVLGLCGLAEITLNNKKYLVVTLSNARAKAGGTIQ